ncbi:helix-turn-helix domain-containing protein [Gloeobacter kilaueensis]|uniref:Transcriptional regulator n=1 Tax=Gloeobacter kilaueensis (strain ATCC BAA-2537 / CCAP 1431/1 / ULC 316 / JS1) TaxID=1183438 RepID=U5QE98_GLOK1|nr:helix-turn-helix domain-containing protein [Gloeobacter kilaueensis]AGY57246.1 transcriptional regulator [Gloeobacter kilaueensis JS1]
MPSKKQPIFPSEKKLLADFGERLRLARLRREISAETLAERASISRMTLYRAEKGSPAVALGTYLRILAALHLQDDINLLAQDDRLGRKLQDLELPKRREAK